MFVHLLYLIAVRYAEPSHEELKGWLHKGQVDVIRMDILHTASFLPIDE